MASQVDVTDEQSVGTAVGDAISSLGQIDILVNNAGIIATPGWEERETPNEADWDTIYAVNVKGLAGVTEAVATHMKARRYGKIVNIASVAGRVGTLTNIPYGVSKAGVINYTQAKALELAPFDINVNAILPGHRMVGHVATHYHALESGPRAVEGPIASGDIRTHYQRKDAPRQAPDGRGHRQPGGVPGIGRRGQHHGAGRQTSTAAPT